MMDPDAQRSFAFAIGLRLFSDAHGAGTRLLRRAVRVREQQLCGLRRVSSGTVCANEHRQCVLEEQTTACNMLDAGDQCIARALAGICDRGVCLPGCGDGGGKRGKRVRPLHLHFPVRIPDTRLTRSVVRVGA